MATRNSETAAASTTRWLDPDEQDAWVALAHVLVELPTTLDAQLQRDAGLNLFEYFVLSRLSMTEPDRTCRMSELAEMTGGSLSRLSNVVKRLEDRGWLRREPDPSNARYTNVSLTESGMEKVVEAAPGHVTAVRALVIDPLSQEQVEALATIGKLIRCRIQSS